MPRRAKMVCVLILLLAAGSLSLRGQSSAISSPGISNGYIAPTSKVGVNDTVYAGLLQYRPARSARFDSIGSKLQIYPTGWNGFEANNVPPSTDPNLVCAPGFVRVPQNEAQRVANGYHKFRCLSQAEIDKFSAVFLEDQARGVEVIGGAYAPPVQYRYPGCRPVPWAGGTFDGGCVPREDAMDDYEDYVNFLAHYFNGANGRGKITHFLIWNEFQSGRWFNYDPVVPWDKNPLSPQDIDLLAEKYKQLLVRAHGAIARHLNPARPAAMLYISLDREVLPSYEGGIYHMDTVAGLLALWSKINTTIDWSVSIHPYGEPAVVGAPVHNYANLHFLVEWQMQRLAERGITEPLNRPQAFLLANEQGWQFPAEADHITRAVYMCQAHDISMKLPPLIGSTHANFQVGQDCQTGAVHNDPYGLIPASAGCNLSGLDTQFIPEWLAYQATSPSNWGRNNSHGCCSALGFGCVAPIAGFVDGVFFENGEYVLRGWACSPGSNESIVVHLYGNGPAGGGGTLAGAYNANLPSEPAVSGANGCRSAGKNFRFRIPLTQWTPQYRGVTLWVHGISPYGAPNDLLPGSGAYSVP